MTRTPHIVASLCALVVACACSTTPALAVEPEAPPCPNEQVRTEQSFASGLGDCRAYEMVSPLAKDDNGVDVTGSARAAGSGGGIVYFSSGAFAAPKSTLLQAPYLSRREAGGWSTRNLSPPFVDYVGVYLTTGDYEFEELLFTPELSRGVVASPFQSLVSGQPAGYSNLYVANTATGSYEAVTTVQPEAEYEPFREKNRDQGLPEAEGASSDLSHVVFQQSASLCCGASPGGRAHVYEWADGSLRQVDVPPPGGKLEGEDVVGSAELDEGEQWRAVSVDGSRVVFTGGEYLSVFASGPSAGQVYVRENPMSVEGCGEVGDACTVEVSASQRTDGMDPNAGKGPAGGAAWYRGASVDGSMVFFTSRVELTNDANTGPEDNAGNLYEYDLETKELTDLTVPVTAAEQAEDPDGAAVLGLVTVSEDGSYVYFVANGVLASNENTDNEKAQPGDCKLEGVESLTGERTCNLYVAHYNGAGWEDPKFIATLVGGDEGNSVELDEEDWVGYEGLRKNYGAARHDVRVTPSGTELAFVSERDLSQYDNRAAAPGVCGGSGRCSEVYLYDATTGRLVCASCDPDGSRPAGPAKLDRDNPDPFYIRRNLSEDGGRLFFETPDALVPHDGNGLVDVYEWERPASTSETANGENSCTPSSPDFHASSGGCVFPVSDVAGDHESSFMDASANGNDVFIGTADQLVPSDTDTLENVFDVRVGGGFPVTVSPPECDNADSCKPPVSPQPAVFGVPGSAMFSGPGNAAPAVVVVPSPSVVVKPKTRTVRCRKGFVKKKVRKKDKCVRVKVKNRAKRSGHGKGRA